MEKTKVDLGRPGSFVSSQAIHEKIEASKVAEEINRSQGSEDKEKDAALEAVRVKEIDDLLPKEVVCFLGKVSFETFKKWYKVIWDQVASKDHLARGYCVYDSEPAPGLTVSYRTLRTSEVRLLSRLSPTTLPNSNVSEYSEESFRFRAIRIALGVVGWDGKTLAPLVLPKSGTKIDDWLALPEVMSRIAFVDNLPEELVDIVASTLTDLAFAYRLALQENLKNRYAPL